MALKCRFDLGQLHLLFAYPTPEASSARHERSPRRGGTQASPNDQTAQPPSTARMPKTVRAARSVSPRSGSARCATSTSQLAVARPPPSAIPHARRLIRRE